MVFQIVHDSAWAYILAAVVFLLIAALIAIGVKGKMTDGILMGGVLAVFICCACALGLFYQNTVQTNASFSKQLMEEHQTTSKRPFTAIQAELFRDHEATDVFIRDGKETRVVIKQVSRDDNQFVLDFIRVDGGLPYQTPAE